MKLYLVLWRSTSDKTWFSDGLFAERAIAEAKLTFETIAHPAWLHCIVEVDAPAIAEEQT
jgi:hypothetical protein